MMLFMQCLLNKDLISKRDEEIHAKLHQTIFYLLLDEASLLCNSSVYQYSKVELFKFS